MNAEFVRTHSGHDIYKVIISPLFTGEVGYIAVKEGDEANRSNNIFNGLYAPTANKAAEAVNRLGL